MKLDIAPDLIEIFYFKKNKQKKKKHKTKEEEKKVNEIRSLGTILYRSQLQA